MPWLYYAVPLVVLALILALVLWLHLFRRKQTVYNYDELKNWIVKEKKAGATEEEIVCTLQEHTHWSLSEIKKFFAEPTG